MYWPLSAPRVFAAPPKPKAPPDEGESAAAGEYEEIQEDTAIIGLQTSRTGQLFATITATTLDIWQVSVRKVSLKLIDSD
jgi:hypothetical protein